MLRQLAAAAWALRRLADSRDIRRAETAWMLGWAAEWAWLVALFVVAYGAGGLGLVGVLGFARTLPAALLAPALSGLVDRAPRHRALLAVHAGRAALVGTAAMAMGLGWSPLLLLAIVPLDGMLGVLHRPTHMAMMPALARSPDELVVANVASSVLEGAGTLLGPIAGGLLVATGSAALGFAVPAAGFALAAIAVLAVQPAGSIAAPAPRDRGLDLVLGGARSLRRHPHAALLLGLFSLQTLVRGLLAVQLVVVAIELLRIGEEGVGFLNAAIGFGGFAGSLAAMSLVGRARLAPPVLVGLLLWGLPILAIGVAPSAAVAFLALAVLGGGNAVLDVAGFTLLQRTVPNAVRGRIFGLLEALVMLTVAIGSALAPLMAGALGVRGALLATGLVTPVAALLAWRQLRRADERAVIPARELAILGQVPMLARLPMTVLEEIAGALGEVRYPEGSRVLSEGDVGDRFFIIVEGSAQALIGDRPVRSMARGESFGEIALLRDVPRTATVVAQSELLTLTLGREAFLAAVLGDRRSLDAAERVVDERLAVRG